MQFITAYFAIFMTFSFIGYYIVPCKYRYLFLLSCNILYYLSWLANLASLFSLISVILITWIGAKLVENTADEKYRKIFLTVTVILTLGSLLYFKYADFFLENITAILRATGLELNTRSINPLMPIGISFYTFQSLSYVFEIYRKKLNTEKNLLLYAAYVTFFPTILSGDRKSVV